MGDLIPESLLKHLESPKGRIHPRDKGILEFTEISNSCGDKFEMTIGVYSSPGRVYTLLDPPIQFKWLGEGCMLSKISCSIMCEILEGRVISDASGMMEQVIPFLMGVKDVAFTPGESLRELDKFHRKGCLALPWILGRSLLQKVTP